MFLPPRSEDYSVVSHWSGCDVEQPINLAWEAYYRDLEENDRMMDDMESRGVQFRPIYPDGEIPF